MKPFSREVDSTMSSSIHFHHRNVRSSWPTLSSTYLIYFILSCVVGVSAQTPSMSQCATTVDGAKRITNCSSLGLSSVPVDLDPFTTELYLDYNNINTIRNNSFSYLQQLKTLSARSNGVVAIEPRGLAGLTELDVLDLSDNELVSISAEALDNCNPDRVTIDGNLFTEDTLRQFSLALAGKRLSKLSVKGNPTFVNITKDTFKPLFNLQFLDISGCDIKSLPKRAFDGFRRLKELYIENNTNLAHIDNDAFLNMQQLETLSLAGCALERVTIFLKDKAVHLQSLKNMDLSRNLISGIDQYSFYPMKSIRHLDLSRNKFEQITIFNEFVGLTGLKYLDLSRNPLFYIADKSFRGVSDIDTLDLSDCQFSSLESQELWGLYTLSKLYLNNNPLTYLSNAVFETQSSISEIYLTNCRLTQVTTSFKGLNFTRIVADNNLIRNIAPDAFSGCARLNELKLQGNKLQSIPEALCANPTIQNVDISNNMFNSIDSKTMDCLREWSFFDGSKNPYTCDGRLVDFTVFANDTGRSVVQQWPDGYRCNAPIEWQNQTVHHYINTQWLTTTTTTTTTTVAPTTETVTTEQLTTIKPTTEQGTTVEPTTEQITTVQPTTEHITTVEATTELMTTVQPTTEKITTIEPTTEQITTVATEHITTVEPTTEQITTVEPTTEHITTVEPTTEHITTVEPTTEHITTVKPTTEQITTTEPSTERITTPEITTEQMTTNKVTTEQDTTLLPTRERMSTAGVITTRQTTAIPRTTSVAATSSNSPSPVVTTTLPLTPTTNKVENISGPFESRQISDRDAVIISISTVLGVAFIVFLIIMFYIVVFNGSRRNKSWTVTRDINNSHKQSYNKFEMTNIEIDNQMQDGKVFSDEAKSNGTAIIY
ncbi:unnamed protein product [Owenia fusiformis]|uniref:Uncharacterized protein n=1 Tax=Owenia fusiformis TaxID=6347 RepID=A0A8J1Y8X3_OWEFU|nr:unnamed protein product [Owenia fusiformis]